MPLVSAKRLIHIFAPYMLDKLCQHNNYVDMQHINVKMKDNYVACKHSYVTIKENFNL